MKERSIPSTAKVSEEIRTIVRRRLEVDSQEDLAALALRKLKKENKLFSLSPIRAKRIALGIPEIEVKAKTKKNHTLVSITSCPVCESAINPIEVMNLANRKIVVGWKCTKCRYESDLEAFVPMKYSFVWKA
jgi:hypothetical protein